MRNLILTVITVCSCLLLADSANTQRKPRSQVEREFPPQRKRDRSPSKPRPKPLPSLGGGTLAPSEPLPRDLPTPATTTAGPAPTVLIYRPIPRAPQPLPLPAQSNTLGLPAQAAARADDREKARVKAHVRECKEDPPTSPEVRCVVATEVSVRSDFNSFFVGTLYAGERFRVRAVHEVRRVDKKTGEVFYPCYFFGDAFGNVDRRNVWVRCNALEKRGARPMPRHAVKAELHKAGGDRPNTVTTREHLRNRFASTILSETLKGTNGRPGNIEVKPEVGTVTVFGNYNPRKSKDPLTRGFLNRVKDPISVNDPNITLHGRYVTKNGKAVVLNVTRRNPVTGNKQKSWVLIDRDAVRIINVPR